MTVLAGVRSIVPASWRVAVNVVLYQAAWFACVALAAREQDGWAVASVVLAVGIHLLLSDKPRADVTLVMLALAVGLVWDTLAIRFGWISYASPRPVAGFAPAWILALWALFASALREPLRWLHTRPWLAMAFGAIGGPLSYAAAARMGACLFDDPVTGLIALGLGWAVMTPWLIAQARRLDIAHGRRP